MTYFDRHAFRMGLGAAALVVAAIVLGSSGLENFDQALTAYAVACIFAAFAVAYRYAVWAGRPPTRMFLRRGLEAFLGRGPSFGSRPRRPTAVAGNVLGFGRLLLDNFVLQKFITRRGIERWVMHAGLSWGGMLAFGVTFPLVFGWVHFETAPDDATVYRALLFGFTAAEFAVDSWQALLFFNLLNVSAILMLAGLALSVRLRMKDKSELAVQTFADDVFPLFLLFTVCVTGLMLTVSAKFMAGYGFPFIGLAHAASVVGLLLYLPFGKLFHIVQRPLSLGVSFYRSRAVERAFCHRCGGDFASRVHVNDLKTVLDELEFDYRFGELHYQDICPPCRRRLLALNQGAAVGR